MTISTSNIKLKRPERLTDLADGGGRQTGIEVEDGELNNVFTDISRLDRVTGRVSLRKAFFHVDSPNTDALLGAHAILIQPPADTRVFELPPAVFLPIAQAPPTSATLYASVARPLYEHIKTARRQVPVGAVLNEGVVTLPGGETVDINDVDTSGPVPTIPSEFAGAETV